MKHYDLEKRTLVFSVEVVKLLQQVKWDSVTSVLRGQSVRSATSVGANYREARRAQSHRDFIHKLAIAEKEAAEAAYWLELLEQVDPGHAQNFTSLAREAGEILAILITIGRKTKERSRNQDI